MASQLQVLTKYKAAVVQAEPGWFDLEASVQKTIDLINEAADKGCKLIAFPEVWIPGYPWWMWRYSYPATLNLLKAYRESSLPSNSPQMHRIRQTARSRSIHVSLGYSELDMATLYITQVLISSSGTILNHRRKLKPTHVERLVYGEGTGDSLDSVVETSLGRIGQLNCWENLNPLLKAHSAAQGEQVHIAAWPFYPPATGLVAPDPYTNVADPNADIVTPAYAIETATFVLAPFQTVSAEGVRKNCPEALRDTEQMWKPDGPAGFARFIKPDGSRNVEDPKRSFEGLVIGEVDTKECGLSKALLDMGGHYTRPDVIRLLVDKRPKHYVVQADGNKGYEAISTLKRVGLDLPLESGEEGKVEAEVEEVNGKNGKA